MKIFTFKEINGIDWEQFNKSVFRIGRNLIVNGNLKINKLTVGNLKTKAIDGVKVNDFFTTTTDQIVNSTIHFRTVSIATNFNCNNINDLDIPKDALTFTPNTSIVIKGKC